MTTTITTQVLQIAKTKDTNRIKAWWNGLSTAQKAAAIGIIAGLSAGTIYYFIVAGVAVTTSQAVYGAVYAGTIYGTATYLIAEHVIDSKSIADNCEEAEYYDITA